MRTFCRRPKPELRYHAPATWLDAALQQATAGSELCRLLGYARWQVIGLTTLARVPQARGDVAAALAAFDEAGYGEAATDLLNPLPVERARLQLAQGDVGAVESWLTSRGLDETEEPGYASEREYLLLARVLIARGTAERAIRVLRRLRGLAESQSRFGSVVEIRVLEALALDALGDRRGALAALEAAVVAAEPEGELRVFVDGGAGVRALLDRLNGASGSTGYVSRLRALALLASGLSNRNIAEALVVALDTVKKHVSHILDKLEATSRT